MISGADNMLGHKNDDSRTYFDFGLALACELASSWGLSSATYNTQVNISLYEYSNIQGYKKTFSQWKDWAKDSDMLFNSLQNNCDPMYLSMNKFEITTFGMVFILHV